jgi:hypothetical protein
MAASALLGELNEATPVAEIPWGSASGKIWYVGDRNFNSSLCVFPQIITAF